MNKELVLMLPARYLDKLGYVASPYSHESPEIMMERKQAVDIFGAQLFDQGFSVLLPITQSATIAKHMQNPSFGFSAWKKNDLMWVERCDYLLVLMLNGWKRSEGVTAEIKHAEHNKMDILYYDPYVNRLHIMEKKK